MVTHAASPIEVLTPYYIFLGGFTLVEGIFFRWETFLNGGNSRTKGDTAFNGPMGVDETRLPHLSRLYGDSAAPCTKLESKS